MWVSHRTHPTGTGLQEGPKRSAHDEDRENARGAGYKIHSHASRLFSFTFTFGAHLQANALVGEYSTERCEETNGTDARLQLRLIAFARLTIHSRLPTPPSSSPTYFIAQYAFLKSRSPRARRLRRYLCRGLQRGVVPV